MGLSRSKSQSLAVTDCCCTALCCACWGQHAGREGQGCCCVPQCRPASASRPRSQRSSWIGWPAAGARPAACCWRPPALPALTRFDPCTRPRSMPASSTRAPTSARSLWPLSVLWWTPRCSASSTSSARSAQQRGFFLSSFPFPLIILYLLPFLGLWGWRRGGGLAGLGLPSFPARGCPDGQRRSQALPPPPHSPWPPCLPFLPAGVRHSRQALCADQPKGN